MLGDSERLMEEVRVPVGVSELLFEGDREAEDDGVTESVWL